MVWVARYPKLQPLRELTSTLGKMKLNSLQVGPDGRNRCFLGPFRSNTGRNQPSNAQFLFGPATWIRSLARPQLGQALLYLDWKSQEIGIAAALIGDAVLKADYCNGDFYTNFGAGAGILPQGATKETHGDERAVLKAVCLGLNYGLGPINMAEQLDTSDWQVRRWIRAHKLRYRVFWEWLDNTVVTAYARGWIRTRAGWQAKVPEDARPTSVMNWQMQAHGAELLRIATILAVRQGLKITAPVHDALLLEAPADHWREHAHALQSCMVEASRIVLDGFEIPVDGVDDPILYPSRYSDSRGVETWDRVMEIMSRIKNRSLTEERVLAHA